MSGADDMAAKRAEIAAMVSALRLDQERAAADKEKLQEQRAQFFGTHEGVHCDGCGTGPIVGYRYKCKRCQNHDICESCYDMHRLEGKVTNAHNRQALSLDAADHDFKLHKEKGFKSMAGGAAKGQTQKSAPKLKPNDPCSCGSKKKAKKCGCGVFRP